MKTIYPWEPEAEVQGKKRLWCIHGNSSLHISTSCTEKGTTHAMVSLQGIHLDDALWHPNISTGMGLKSFCPWCFTLGRNTETIAIHLREVHYRMTIICHICWVCPPRTCSTIAQDAKCNSVTTCSAQSVKDKRRLTSPKRKRSLKSPGQKGASD